MNYFINHATYKGEELSKDQWRKANYNHSRYGGFLGGPIVKDKLHFFIAYEGFRHTDYATINSPLVQSEVVQIPSSQNQIHFKLNYQMNDKNQFSFRFGMGTSVKDNLGISGVLLATKEMAFKWSQPAQDFQGKLDLLLV